MTHVTVGLRFSESERSTTLKEQKEVAMWKKDDVPEPVDVRRPEPETRIQPPARAGVPGERATIGRSITIKGEVNGDEDLLIQGRVDGSVTLKQNAVTVGSE